MKTEDSSRLVAIAAFSSDAEAHIVQGMLLNHDIPCVLNGEIISSVMGIQLLPSDSIRLMVHERDAERAMALLEAVGDDAEI